MEVVCFFPGLLGSELRTLAGMTVWPPTVDEVIDGSLGADKIAALLSEDDLVSVGAVEKVCLKIIYRGVLNSIEDAGFSRHQGPKHLAVMHHDWRLDIVDEVAPELANRLDELVANGADTFHFVAHSMGGLIARILMQDPQYEGRSWRGKVEQLITMATPFRGAPQALSRLVGLEGMLGIPAWAFAAFRTKPRLRAAYQLLPPKGDPLIWRVAGGRVHNVDLFAIDGFGEQNGFLRNSLDSVGTLHAILDRPWPRNVARFQFAGTGFERF